MGPTGSNHGSNRVDSQVEQCRIISRTRSIINRIGSNEEQIQR